MNKFLLKEGQRIQKELEHKGNNTGRPSQTKKETGQTRPITQGDKNLIRTRQAQERDHLITQLLSFKGMLHLLQ
jgi:hypothetical protein